MREVTDPAILQQLNGTPPSFRGNPVPRERGGKTAADDNTILELYDNAPQQPAAPANAGIEVTDPAILAQLNGAEQPQPEGAPRFLKRVGDDLRERGAQITAANEAGRKGQQTKAETMFQTLASGIAGPVVDVAGEAVKSLYTAGVGPKTQEVLASGAQTYAQGAQGVGQALDKTMVGRGIGDLLLAGKTELENAPRAQRNLQATGDVAMVAPLLRPAKAAAEAVGSVKFAGGAAPKAAKTAKEALPTASEMKTMAGESFDQAAELGGTFTPDLIANPFKKEVKALKPRPIAGQVLTREDKKLISHLEEYDNIQGANLTFDEIVRLDEGLTQKVNDFVDTKTGLPDNNGRKLMILQTKLRDILDSVPDNAANDAQKNARAMWKAQIMMNDLDNIAERASMTQNVDTALRTGYRNLYMDKDRIRGWPPEAKELLKKAATTNMTDDALRAMGSRLTSIIGVGTGNLMGAATTHVVGAAARGAMAKVAAGRGAKVQEAIVKDTMGKIREVKPRDNSNIPQLLLPPPEKMSRMPMSEAEIKRAQKQMKQPKSTGADTSGGAIQVPPKKSIRDVLSDESGSFDQSKATEVSAKAAKKIGKVYYHGGMPLDISDNESLTYFSSRKNVAQKFSDFETQFGDTTVSAANLSLKNPAGNSEYRNAILKLFGPKALGQKALMNEMDWLDPRFAGKENQAALLKELKEEGYDGVVYKTKNETIAVTFNRKQIKPVKGDKK